MKKYYYLLIGGAIIIVAVLAILLNPFGSGKSTPQKQTTPIKQTSRNDPLNPKGIQHIYIAQTMFAPGNIKAAKDDIVEWDSLYTVDEEIIFDSPTAGVPDSGTIKPGGTYQLTLHSAGTLDYHLAANANVKGTITVQD